MEIKKEEIIRHLKKRWESVHKVEIEKLRRTSLQDRLGQTASLFDFGMKLPPGKIDRQVKDVMSRWLRLVDYYNKESSETHS